MISMCFVEKNWNYSQSVNIIDLDEKLMTERRKNGKKILDMSKSTMQGVFKFCGFLV